MGNLKALNQWVKQHNENVSNPALKTNAVEFRAYMRSRRIKDPVNVDRKDFIDWLSSGEGQNLKSSQKRGFEYYNYKIEISLHEKNFLGDMNRFVEGYRFLGAVTREKSDQMDYWYFRVDKKHKNFFTKEILLEEFADLHIPAKQSEQDRFAAIKPFLEKYGTFNNGPDTLNSHWDTMSYMQRFGVEWYTIRHLLSIKRKYGSSQFSKKVAQEPPTKRNDRYWDWYEEFGRHLYELPHDRRLEYFAARPIRRTASSSRDRAETKYIGDHFPYSINLLYKYILGDEMGEWQTCQICSKYFKKSRKDQKCCCSRHSKMARNRKDKKKKKVESQ